MSEYIENVTQHTSKLDWAFPFQRTGAFPIDRSSLFSSYEDAVLYASGGKDSRGLSGSAYVGQPISVYNAETGVVSLFIIDSDRSLKEAGSAPLGDNSSIEIVDNKIQLKGFNSGYYAYIPAEKNSDGTILVEAKYKYTEGFKSGLEARVISVPQDDGSIVYEIGWYEPSSETIDGVGSKLDSLTVEVEALSNSLENKVDKTEVYTKTETESLIAEAAHLKRKIINSVSEIDVNAANADQYIYMVLVIDERLNDKYEEYMVINGAIEKVGAWEVDLSDYITRDTLTETLANYITNASLNTILEEYATTAAVQTKLDKKVDTKEGYELAAISELEKLATVERGAQKNYIVGVSSDFTVSTAGVLSLNEISVAKVTNLQNLLDSKVNKQITNDREWTLLSPENQDKLSALVLGDNGNVEISGKVNAENVEGLASWITANRNGVSGLYPTSDQTKLSSIQEGAEVNVVKSVNNTQMEIDSNGQLTITSIPVAIVSDLESAMLFNRVTDDFTITDKTLALTKNYVENSIYTAQVGNLDELVRLSGKENSTLVDEVNYINERLQWKEMSE